MVRQRKWIAMFCCLFLSLASGYGLWLELAPFTAKPYEQALVADNFAGEEFGFGLSSYSKTLVMRDCYRIVLGYHDFDLVDDAVRGVIARCGDRAARIVAVTPTDSFAWLVRAAASVRLKLDDDFNTALQKSQLTGPNEMWIALLRTNLAETHFSKLNPASVETETMDLALLASSEKGVQLIARRYVSDPDFRARITAVVEKLPQERQLAFLRSVRKSLPQG